MAQVHWAEDTMPLEAAEAAKEQTQIAPVQGGTEVNCGPGELPSGVTTLAIRGLPYKCDQRMLMAQWPMDGSYDYLHLPYNFDKRRPVGYAFINFTSHGAAVAFRRRWQGQTFPMQGHAKTMDIVAVPAVQGGWGNLARLGRNLADALEEVGHAPLIWDGMQLLDMRVTL
mmetsp:Transcript_96935/g.269681  ORF Transcript_96935/g.269681 Transcript_96935/m.269681 type:complete len:170 (-) Transcript_96935:65-574(-)